MQIEEFTEMLDRCGSDVAAWPAHQRAAMEALLERDSAARHALASARRLTERLDAYAVPVPDLSARILAALPAAAPARRRDSLAERLQRWLLPSQPAEWWRPALAAALPLCLGIVVGAATPPPAATAASGAWSLQEQILLGGWYE
jgi:anti-sigma factor RsiW